MNELVLYGWAQGTGSKLNLHQTFREYPVRSIYVQVTSYVQGVLKNENPAMILYLLVILYLKNSSYFQEQVIVFKFENDYEKIDW